MLQAKKQYKFTRNGNSFVGTPLDFDEDAGTADVKIDRILSGEVKSMQIDGEFLDESRQVNVGEVAVFDVGSWGWRVDVYDDQPQAAAGGARKRRTNKRKSNKRKSYRRRRN
jgi:hypothetical protein